MHVQLTLSAAGAEPVHAEGELTVLSTGARLIRAMGIMGVALVLAAMIIPIPIVHLVGIPLILIVGVVVAARQLRSVATLAPIRMVCPRCGANNSLGGGLGLRTATGPLEVNCQSCRRLLELRFVPQG